MVAIDFPSSPVNGQVFGNYTYDAVVGVWRASTQATPGLPAGTILQWPASTPPANWIICDGSALSRTTYASLFAAIGTTYGVGDGSTTFNIPDFRGKFPVGKSTDTEFDVLGETGGSKTIQGYGSGTATGYGLTYSDSMGSATSNTSPQNLPPYNVVNFIIKTSAGASLGDSELAVRVGNVEIANNATPLSPNYAINGGLDFWQRSTSATLGGNTNGFPSADRMRVISSGASSPAITLARSTDIPSGVGVQYSAAMSWSSNISGGDVMIHHGIENGKYLFAGKTVTVSFYAKAATAIQSKFDFDQDYGETFFNLTTSWARYSYTITLPSTYASSRPGGAAANDNVELRFIRFTSISSASNTIYFTGLQVEEGSNATPFRRSAPSLQAELAACQRYYETFAARKLNNEGYANGAGYGYYMNISWAVAKRAVPVVTLPATTSKVTSNESSSSFIDGYSYQFASNGAGNFYMLWNVGLTGSAESEI